MSPRPENISALRVREQAHPPDPAKVKTAMAATLLAAAAGLAALLLFPKRAGDPTRGSARRPIASNSEACTAVARQLNGGASVLAFAVLTDSGLEHHRGLYFNRFMYVPLVVSTMTLGVSLHGIRDEGNTLHRFRDAVYRLAGLTGLAGTGFHLYNLHKRPGRYAFQNLFYGAPIGAPFALLLAGLLGVAGERVRDAGEEPELAGIPEGRALAGVTAAGLLGTVGEVALFHFRGAYHDPFMFLPVTVPPLAAVGMAVAALDGRPTRRPFTRWMLRVTAALGVAGVGFHVYGISRDMGGWRNWSQNLLNGPPLPAPPSFAGLALAGLAALRLLEVAR
jgi:hypothetical protein